MSGREGRFLSAETKSRRVQLWMQPTLVEKTKAVLAITGQSFNALVHGLLEEHIGRIEGLAQTGGRFHGE